MKNKNTFGCSGGRAKNAFLILLIIASLSLSIYMLSFENPLSYQGAISAVGFSRPALFILWGIVTESALFFNMQKMFEKYGCANKAVLWLSRMAVLSMAVTVLVPYDYTVQIKYIFHLSGAVTFIVFNGLSLVIFFFLKRKNGPVFATTGILICFVLMAVLICFLIFKESGILEFVPLAASLLILFTANFTKAYESGKERKIEKNN